MIFKNYHYFLRIVEYKSITKAADNLYISQPSLSKYLSQLEDKLGVKLFDNSRYPLELTYAGELYANYIEEIIKLDKSLEEKIFEITQKRRGKVVLGMAPWRASIILPGILPSFYEKYPEISIELKEGRGDYLENIIQKNQVDFCLINLPNNLKNTSYEYILEERIMMAINKENPINKVLSSNQIDLNEISSERFILLKKGQNLRHIVTEFFNKNNFNPDNIFETENVTTTLRLVERNFGISFIPESGIDVENHENIHFYPINDKVLRNQIAVVYKMNSELSWATKLLITHIKEYMSNSIR